MTFLEMVSNLKADLIKQMNSLQDLESKPATQEKFHMDGKINNKTEAVENMQK